MATLIPPENVFNPRVLEIVVPRQRIGDEIRGPIANRHFIFTGTFSLGPFVFSRTNDLYHELLTLDLSSLPGHPVFDGNPFQLIEVPNPANPQERILTAATMQTSLATIGWSDAADDALWGVDTSQVITSQHPPNPRGHLLLTVDKALAGIGCGLGRISYQVNVLAYRSYRRDAIGQVVERVRDAVLALFR
jgi:hypothetical protein